MSDAAAVPRYELAVPATAANRESITCFGYLTCSPISAGWEHSS